MGEISIYLDYNITQIFDICGRNHVVIKSIGFSPKGITEAILILFNGRTPLSKTD